MSLYRERIFRELRFEFLKTVLLESVLDGAITFLFVYLLISLTKKDVLFAPLAGESTLLSARFLAATVLAIVVFIYQFYTQKARFSLAIYGRTDMSVVEMLQTAYDNMYKDNDVVQDLFARIADRLRYISAGEAFSLQSLSLRFISVTVLAFLVVFSGALTYELPDFGINLPDFAGGSPADDEIQPVELTENGSVYGERELIEIGERKLELDLTGYEEPAPGEEELERQYDRSTYPSNIRPVAAGSVDEEQIEDFELAKEYSVRIRQ